MSNQTEASNSDLTDYMKSCQDFSTDRGFAEKDAGVGSYVKSGGRGIGGLINKFHPTGETPPVTESCCEII